VNDNKLNQINATSSFRNAVLIRQVLEARNIDADQLMRDAGIEPSVYENSNRRVPFKLHEKLFQLMVRRTGDPSIGLDLAGYMSPTHYEALGIALLCSSTLRNFFRRFERYMDVFSTLSSAELHETSYGVYFAEVPRVKYSDESLGCQADGFCALTLRFMRLVYKSDYCPRRVDLIWRPPEKYHGKYYEHFGCEVRFSAPLTAIHVDKADLDVKLPGSNAALAFQNDQLAIAAIANIEKGDLQMHVVAKIMEYLPSGECNKKKVASAMNMSESTFQKKLQVTGSSFQQLLDRTRAEMATHYLGNGGMSILEVAYLLGFNDSSNFSRAFRQWVGVSPSTFRNNQSSI
jgi:AraC-like DNA-binding protein